MNQDQQRYVKGVAYSLLPQGMYGQFGRHKNNKINNGSST